MKRSQKLIILWLAGLALLLGIFAVDARRAWHIAAAASGENAPAVANMEEGPTQLVVAADTTASMQPELDALAAVFNNETLPPAANGRLYHLVGFKDSPNYLGNTDDLATFQNWLQELTAAGGEDCPDAMLQALAAVARNIPDNRTLLLSDASPKGGQRARLAFLINKLVERDINVYPLISGWCDNSELTEAAMFTLARMTGGIPYIVQETEVATATTAALNAITRADTLLVDNNEIDGVEIYDFVVDGTANTLGVEEERCEPVWCLTCTLALNNDEPLPLPAGAGLQLQIRDPEGDILQPGDPGVTVWETAEGTSFLIDIDQVLEVRPPLTSTWQLRVQGTGGYALNVFADSGVHFEYLGRHTLRANRPVPIRVRLATDAQGTAVDESDLHFGLMTASGNILDEIDLFNDGNHGDGDAGDDIYGGGVVLPKGIWYLATWGTLDDGTPFQRVDPTPLRVRGFRMSGSGGGNQLPGTNITQRFALTNEGAGPQTYELYVSSDQGWAMTGTVPAMVTVAAGETESINVPLTIPADATPGDVEEVSLTAVKFGDLSESETVSLNTTVVDELRINLPFIIKP